MCKAWQWYYSNGRPVELKATLDVIFFCFQQNFDVVQ